MKLRFYLLSVLLFSICVYEATAQQKSFLRPEEQGEDLSGLSKAALFQRLDTVDWANICAGKPYKNPGCVELQKIGRVLGNRHLAGTLNLNKKEKQTIYRLVEAYLDYYTRLNETGDESGDGFGEATSQCYRLWSLAYPALMAHVADKDPDLAQFAVNTLLDMRNEEVIRFFVDLAQQETNRRKRNWWMQLLGFIGKNGNIYIADDIRTPIDSATNTQLYEKHAKAIYEEWKATLIHPSTRLPCPEGMDDTSQTVQPPVPIEVPQSPGFDDTLYWVNSSMRDVIFVLKSAAQAAPALGETTISVDSAYMLNVKTVKGGILLESKVNIKDLDIGENGVYLIKPTKALAYPGIRIKVKPERPDVKQFKNNKLIGKTRELQLYMPDQQYVEWLFQQLQSVINTAQGRM